MLTVHWKKQSPQALSRRKCANCGTGWRIKVWKSNYMIEVPQTGENRKSPTAGYSCVCWSTVGITTATPGIVALLTGDGAGYYEGRGFHSTLERMHRRGWKVEVLSWEHSCYRRMRQWAEENGVFVPLDDYYWAITFREPSREGHEFAPARDEMELDLTQRPMA